MENNNKSDVSKQNRFIKGHDLVIENLVAILILTALFSVTYGILSRNLPFLPFFIWTEELSRYSMITMVFVIAGLSVRKGVHLGLDMLLERLPELGNKVLMTFINIVVIVFLAMLVYIFFTYAPQAIQVSPALGIPRTYLYIIMGIGFFLMISEMAALTIRLWKGERA